MAIWRHLTWFDLPLEVLDLVPLCPKGTQWNLREPKDPESLLGPFCPDRVPFVLREPRGS